jgi:hypothetical protein
LIDCFHERMQICSLAFKFLFVSRIYPVRIAPRQEVRYRVLDHLIRVRNNLSEIRMPPQDRAD